MTAPTAGTGSLPLLVFDGDCGFCTSSAGLVERRARSPIRTEPWQVLGPEGLAPFGLTTADAGAAAWWIDREGRPHRGHRAVARALQEGSRAPLRLAGTLMLVPPVSWLAAAGYRLVTRYRHRLPGGTPACRA